MKRSFDIIILPVHTGYFFFSYVIFHQTHCLRKHSMCGLNRWPEMAANYDNVRWYARGSCLSAVTRLENVVSGS